MSNRVLAYADRVAEKLNTGGKDGALDTPEKIAAFEKTMDLDFNEHFAYQNAQAKAHVTGKITAEEAQTVYAALGEVGSDENGGWAKDTSLAMKVTVTQMIGELIGAA